MDQHRDEHRPESGHGGTDPLLAALVANPFSLRRPERQLAPFVFASPHSGRNYPLAFLAQSRLSALDLRKSEDAFVDELFEGVPQLGAPFLAANFPRVYVDVNRSPGELDPALFGPLASGASPASEFTGTGRPASDTGARSARVAVGLGVIPRIVRDGLEIYGHKLDRAEAEFRLNAFYKPYHAMLRELIGETLERFGVAIVVDCHSMPSPPKRSDIVLGDRYGDSASGELMAIAQSALASLNFDVARNAPYAGGYTTALYGRPRAGVHALQIEINRDLYWDDAAMEKNPAFDTLRNRLYFFAERLLAQSSAVLPPQDRLRAAE